MDDRIKTGNLRWILVRRDGRVDLVQAKAVFVDEAAETVTFRWQELGRDRTEKRKFGRFWKAAKDAEEAMVRIFGKPQRWTCLKGVQLKWFT